MQQGWPGLQQGEAIAVVERQAVGVPRIERVIAAAKSAHGVDIIEAPRCAVVDASHRVVDVVKADPTTYRVPAVTAEMLRKIDALKAHEPEFALTPTPPFSLKASPEADVGDSFAGDQLVKRPSAKPAVIDP